MREKFKWNVQLQRDDGDMATYPIQVYWDPKAEDASEAVGNAAAAEAYVKGGKTHKYAAVAATRAK